MDINNIHYETIVKISTKVALLKDPKEIILSAVKQVTCAVGAKGCALFLFYYNRNSLKLAGSYGLSDDYLDKGPVSSTKSIVSSLREKLPIVISDVKNDLQMQYPEAAEKEGIASILSVPMLVGDKLTGCMRIYTSEIFNFDSNCIDFVQVIANIIGLNIELRRINKSLRSSIKILRKYTKIDGYTPW